MELSSSEDANTKGGSRSRAVSWMQEKGEGFVMKAQTPTVAYFIKKKTKGTNCNPSQTV